MSYRMSRGSGFVTKPTQGMASPLNQASKIEKLVEAGGAIPVGRVVVQGAAGDGTEVIAALQANAIHGSTEEGVYEGQGGTGAEPVVMGLVGRAAVDGDQIWVTCSGVGRALVTPTTTANMVPGVALALRAGTNDLTDGAAATPPAQSGIYLLETTTVGGAQTSKNVMIRLM